MTLTQSTQKIAILRHFSGGFASPAFLDVFADVLDRALLIHEENPADDLADNIANAIDDGLIYYADQWEIIKYYQTPENANLSDAIDELYNDLYAVASEIIENQ